MSLGWIIVVILGIIPLALVFLTSGKGNRGANNSSNRKRRNNGFVYSGWKVVLTGDLFMNVSKEVTVFNSEEMNVIENLVKECDVFVVTKVSSDQEESTVRKCLTTEKQFNNNSESLVQRGLNENKILFCETNRGVIAIARQIEPDLFIGTDPAVTKELSRFLPNVMLIRGNNNATGEDSTTTNFSTLSELCKSITGK